MLIIRAIVFIAHGSIVHEILQVGFLDCYSCSTRREWFERLRLRVDHLLSNDRNKRYGDIKDNIVY